MENTKSIARLEIIEVLRGFAALAVTWFHYTNGNSDFLDDGWLKLSGKYGWLGVEVFFILSGFIIPYSLWCSNFKLKLHWQKFLVKRVLRIYPAYLATILLIISFWYICTFMPNYQGGNENISFYNILLHVSLLNGILHQPWLNSAFWTLGIEFQYYLLIIFIYPLLTSSKVAVKVILFLLLCFLPFVFSQDNLIISWLLLFNFGIITFQVTANQITLKQYWIVIFFITVLTYFNKELLVASVGFITSVAIAFAKFPKLTIFSSLGELSYSLYLLHNPVGGKVIYLASLIGKSLVIKFISLLFALTISIYAAYFMCKYIERPTQRYLKNIIYNS
jgi:peptidoglycan/LPS O-acetylase OafA/YrhL